MRRTLYAALRAHREIRLTGRLSAPAECIHLPMRGHTDEGHTAEEAASPSAVSTR
jgi:hypothetical protein